MGERYANQFIISELL